MVGTVDSHVFFVDMVSADSLDDSDTVAGDSFGCLILTSMLGTIPFLPGSSLDFSLALSSGILEALFFLKNVSHTLRDVGIYTCRHFYMFLVSRSYNILLMDVQRNSCLG